MPKNILRELLNDHLPSKATRILSTWPSITEAVASTKQFDYIEFVAEYAPCTQSDMENICRAAELHGIGTMIKIDFQNRAFVGQKAMGAGFQAVLLTDHKTAEEVEESLYFLRPDTPWDNGRFGYPNRRWIGYTPNSPQMDYAEMVRNTVIAVMIEKKAAMDNIEEICQLEGVDMVQFGPSDYSMSCGFNMAEYQEECKEAERLMIKTALKYNVQPRCEIHSPDEAHYYIDLGVKHFCLGDELKNNMTYWQIQGEKLNEIIKGQ